MQGGSKSWAHSEGAAQLERALRGCEAVSAAARSAAAEQRSLVDAAARANGHSDGTSELASGLATSLEQRLEAIARESTEVADLARRSLALMSDASNGSAPATGGSSPNGSTANGNGRIKALSLLVTEMRANGLDRSEIEARLRGDFGLETPAAVLGALDSASDLAWHERAANGH